MKGGLRDPKADLKLAVFVSCLGITVLGYPPLSKETPSVIAIVRVGGIRRRGRHRGCSIRGLAGPGKRMKAIIQDEPIDKLEKFIAMSRRYRSHLICRRRWLTGMSSSRISSTARLPWLSLPTMKFGWIHKKGEEGCYRVCEGVEVKRNMSGYEYRCV